MDVLTQRMSVRRLFPQQPTVAFEPERSDCTCGRCMTVRKTRRKEVSTMEIGTMSAHETVLECTLCKLQRVSVSADVKARIDAGG